MEDIVLIGESENFRFLISGPYFIVEFKNGKNPFMDSPTYSHELKGKIVDELISVSYFVRNLFFGGGSFTLVGHEPNKQTGKRAYFRGFYLHTNRLVTMRIAGSKKTLTHRQTESVKIDAIDVLKRYHEIYEYAKPVKA